MGVNQLTSYPFVTGVLLANKDISVKVRNMNLVELDLMVYSTEVALQATDKCCNLLHIY